jgi:hypothetical protein
VTRVIRCKRERSPLPAVSVRRFRIRH